jgi:hypothetical protein
MGNLPNLSTVGRRIELQSPDVPLLARLPRWRQLAGRQDDQARTEDNDRSAAVSAGGGETIGEG